jgi:predicted amidohydrolase
MTIEALKNNLFALAYIYIIINSTMMPMKRYVNVAAIQMEIIPLDIEANLTKAEKILEATMQSSELDLAVFPEDCITGPIPYSLDYALDEHSEAILFFKKLAKNTIYTLYAARLSRSEIISTSTPPCL